MIGLTGLTSGIFAPAAPASGTRKDPPENIQKAAEQFEALLIGQMLRQIRESGSGSWMGDGEDQAAGNMMGLAEEQLAQVLASQGGLGLARLTAGSIAPTGSAGDT